MVGIGAWAAAMALLYGSVLVKMAGQWQTDATYSHGWLILPVALMLAWRQRDRLRVADSQPSIVGLFVVLASLIVYGAGVLGAELFLTRVSVIGVLAGSILFVYGGQHLRLLAFPVAFLIFMIPLPAIVLDRISVSLQLVASALGEQLLRAADVAVLRDGNILQLSTVKLEVNEGCSGIRSLIALISMTALLGYLFEPTWLRRGLLLAASVPLAIALNGVRIGITGLAALRFGPWAAQGTAHEAAGAIVFVVAIGCICAMQRVKLGRRFEGRLEAA